MDQSSNIANALSKFISTVSNPEEFVRGQPHLFDEFKNITKILYNAGKCTEEKLMNKRIKLALPKLIIKNFDEEQIWQEIELQNKPSLLYLTKLVHNLAKNIPSKICGTRDKLPLSGATEECNKKIEKSPQKSVNIKSQKRKVKPSLTPSVVDDKFFKLSELEAFLDAEDAKVNELSDNEDSIDYFDSLMSEDDDEKLKSGREARYEDFFDVPTDELDDDMNESFDKGSEEDLENDETMFDDRIDGSDIEDSEGEQCDDDEEYDIRDVDDKELEDTKAGSVARVASDSENEVDVNKTLKPELQQNKIKSTFQKRQDKLQQKIKELEEQQLSEKPWQLKGEISATFRPENCLLEEHVKFDHVGRPAPVITEETTMKLEDIIKQRIKDKAWDDVERKVKPPEHPFEYRRQIILEQEKSKMSLAEVYEQEYVKHQKSQKEDEETELPAHREIKKIMSTLFTQLDALSNFRFKPRPPVPDIKVVSNLPALTVEEVAPMSVSDATLLAPEEIKAKVKGTVKGRTERDATDRKRERRKKKLAQKMKSKRREKMSPRSELGDNDKKSKKDALKRIKKRRNVTVVKESGKVDSSLKSSKAFFSNIQDRIETSMSAKMKKKQKK